MLSRIVSISKHELYFCNLSSNLHYRNTSFYFETLPLKLKIMKDILILATSLLTADCTTIEDEKEVVTNCYIRCQSLDAW